MPFALVYADRYHSVAVASEEGCMLEGERLQEPDGESVEWAYCPVNRGNSSPVASVVSIKLNG